MPAFGVKEPGNPSQHANGIDELKSRALCEVCNTRSLSQIMMCVHVNRAAVGRVPAWPILLYRYHMPAQRRQRHLRWLKRAAILQSRRRCQLLPEVKPMTSARGSRRLQAAQVVLHFACLPSLSSAELSTHACCISFACLPCQAQLSTHACTQLVVSS